MSQVWYGIVMLIALIVMLIALIVMLIALIDSVDLYTTSGVSDLSRSGHPRRRNLQTDPKSTSKYSFRIIWTEFHDLTVRYSDRTMIT